MHSLTIPSDTSYKLIEATNKDNYTPLQLARSYGRVVERAKITNSLETYDTVSG